MKKTLVIAVVVGVLAGVGGRMALKGNAGPTPADAGPSADSLNDQVAANGKVEGASPEVELRPEVAGLLVTVNARENALVKKGQVIAELSNEAQKAQVALAAAELALAQQQLTKLQNGERAQVRRRAKDEEDARHQAYELAERDYQRASLTGRGISSGELDAARTKMTLAKAEWEKAKDDLALIEEGARADDLTIAKRQVEAAGAKLRGAEAELAKTRLTAPTDGTVLKVQTEPGEMAAPAGAKPVVIFADLSKRRVRASVEELDFSRVEVGQAATVTADGLPGRTFTGKVSAVLPRMGKTAPHSDAPTEMTDLYYREVLIDLDGGDELTTNLRVQVRLQAKGAEKR